MAPSPGLRKADIVMKGGVTSGIVYPAAVRTLADAFEFVNIGGTSAGAIAAALTAAAEYRRKSTGGDMAGYERLSNVPDDLGVDHALLGLFRPNSATAPLFEFIVALVTAKTATARLGVIVAAPFRGTLREQTFAVAVAGTLLAALVASTADARASLGSIALLILGVLVAIGFWYYRMVPRAVSGVVANGYGLSTGVNDADPNDRSRLSVWLSDLIDEVAGLPPGEHLTFGHLWFARTPTAHDPETCPQPRKLHEDDPASPLPAVINLQMVSTCVSAGRPYTFPTGSRIFYFEEAELRKYLPASVVDWMLAKRRDALPNDHVTDGELLPFVRMPVDRDLPVVLAARMSLAFPLLLSAVPLGAIDYGALEGAPPGTKRKPEQCWFADGGLSSNFPIHLFDDPLPRWPTFAINLGSFAPGETDYDPRDESKNVRMPRSNDDGWLPTWQRFDSSSWSGALAGYVVALMNAVKDWNDKLEMELPGFRDRIVTVKLRDSEGGLNLDMGWDVIEALTARGRAAGALLEQRFNNASDGVFTKAMNWQNHRITRYRVTMNIGQQFMEAFARGFKHPQAGDVSYETILTNAANTTMEPYAWGVKPGDATRAEAAGVTKSFAELSDELDRRHVDFEGGAPSPKPSLAKRAKY